MKYVKKPVVIEAFQWDGGTTPNPRWMDEYADKGKISFVRRGDVLKASIFTISGVAHMNLGDYLVNAGGDDIYPIKKDIFERTYEEVKDGVQKEEKAVKAKKVKNG